MFVTPGKALEISTAEINEMGCLSASRFPNRAQSETHTTGKKADARSFCIRKPTVRELMERLETGD